MKKCKGRIENKDPTISLLFPLLLVTKDNLKVAQFKSRRFLKTIVTLNLRMI